MNALIDQTYEDYLSDEPGQHGIPDGLSRAQYTAMQDAAREGMNEYEVTIRMSLHPADDTGDAELWDWASVFKAVGWDGEYELLQVKRLP